MLAERAILGVWSESHETDAFGDTAQCHFAQVPVEKVITKEVVVEVEKQVSTKSVCSEHARASA